MTPAEPSIPAEPPASAPTLTTGSGDISTAEPGAQIELVGTGYAPYSTVTIVIYSTPRPIGTAVADASGAFRRLVTVPADLAAGRHTFLATGVDPAGNAFSRTLTVTVKAAAPVPSPTPSPSPSADDDGPLGLPRTGANIALVAALGLLLIGAGAALLLVRRRPR